MNRAERIASIRQKCIEAGAIGLVNLEGREYGREVRLADVLLAIKNAIHNKRLDFDTFSKAIVVLTTGLTDKVSWKLRNDDLNLQSDNTLKFIHSMLS